MRVSQTWWMIIVISVVGLFFRVLLIDKIPTSFTHDEMFFAVEGQSVALDGWDLKGKVRPWLEFVPSHGAFSELPGSLLAPGFWLISNPVVASRAVPILVGLLIPLLLGAITWELIKDKKVMIAVVAIAEFNPWIFQFSRSSIDPPIGMALVLLGKWLQLKLRGRNKLWSVVAYGLGFFTYQAYKLVIPLLVICTSIYSFLTDRHKKSKLKWSIFPAIAILGVMLFYSVNLRTQEAGKRINALLPLDQSLLSGLVDKDRRLSLPNPMATVFTNKLTEGIERFLVQYGEALNPRQLFVKGEANLSPFAVWSVGMFYELDIILILIGLVVIFKKKQKVGFYLLGLAAVAPIPTALSAESVSVTFRSSLMIFPLLILAGIGLVTIIQTRKRVVILLVGGGYLLLVTNFLYQYFFRYPLYAADGLFLSDRIVSSYAARTKEVLVVTNDEPFFLLENYLFFNKKINKDNIGEIRAVMSKSKFALDGVKFVKGCVDSRKIAAGEVVIAAVDTSECKGVSPLSDFKNLSISRVTDSGERYRIYGDRLCSGAKLRPYVYPQSLDSLAIEKLNDESFCREWITDVSQLK